ncbi:eukaryotic translation initiation factor 4E [Sporobolomyces koalae]|uniref:eukaryotic translation initiation factor 4E n=1 Tax=Sporobolomyces koalae TaxID=500713 RepID=UPI00316B3858
MSTRPTLQTQNSSSRRGGFQTRGSSTVAGSSPRQTADRNGYKKAGGPSLSLALNSTPQDVSANGQTIHPLKYTWDVFFSHRSGSQKANKKEEAKNGGGQNGPGGVQKEEWEEGVVKLGGFSSIESLHPFLAHLVPPSALPSSLHTSFSIFSPESTEPAPQPVNVICDYNIFRSSIAPAWEDAANVGGGRWVLRLRKGVADRVWEETVYALVGERIGDDENERVGEKVNGVVLSVRKDEDILSVWVAPSNRTERDIIRDSLRNVLAPLLTSTSSANLQLDYKPHPVVGSSHSSGDPQSQRHMTGTNASRLLDLSNPANLHEHTPQRRNHSSTRHDLDSDVPLTGSRRTFDRSTHSRDSTPIGSGRTSGFSSYVSRNSESVERRSGIDSPFNRSRESSPAPGGAGVGVIGGGLFGRTRSQRGELRRADDGEQREPGRSSATSWGRA